ncbi:hypothetical protein EAF00_005448 [Botryotinia globosa]|nr:hypothetical protein EAF00_005448 [Botryotinia globosa]
MDSGDMDRVPLDDRIFLDERAPLGSQTCDGDGQNEPGYSIVKGYEDLEVQKAEFKKLQEDHQKQVHEFEEAKIELEDKIRTFKKMEVENERKLDVLRAEQVKFSTRVKAFNESLGRAREAAEWFNKKSMTLKGKFMAAKNRENSFFRECKDRRRRLVEREQRIDAKLKRLGIEKFFDPDRESSEFSPSIPVEIKQEREE